MVGCLAKVPDKRTWAENQGHAVVYLRPPLFAHMYYSKERRVYNLGLSTDRIVPMLTETEKMHPPSGA